MWLTASRLSSTFTITNTSKAALPAVTDPLTSFSLLNYNIDCDGAYRSINTENVLTAIVSSNADVICLQESHGDWQRVLQPQLSTLYPHQSWHEPPPNTGPGGLAILSKFPILADVILDNGSQVEGSWFPQWFGIVQHELSGSKIGICNVHLRPPLDELGYQWSLMSPVVTNSVRLSEVKFIVNFLAEQDFWDMPLLITGDFNENDSGGTLSYLTNSHGIGRGFFSPKHSENTSNISTEQKIGRLVFKDAVNEKVPSNIETHRFPVPFGDNLILRSRLDHVLYNVKYLKCESCTVIPGFEHEASDHMPVLAIFTFQKGKKE